MLNKLIFSVVACINIVAYSCNGQVTSNINQPGPADSIVREIPLGKDGKPVFYYLTKDEIERKVGLSTIENGYDQLQIRLWYGYSFNDTSQLVIFKKKNSNWTADLYILKYNYDKSCNSIFSINKKVITGYPSSGWQSFIKSLTNLKIFTLPDYHLIPEYHLNTDEGGVTVEI